MHAEDLAEEIRKRVQLGNLTFRESEILRIVSILEKLSYRLAEAYQVVGSLADDAGCHDDPAVVKAMDLLFQPLRRGDMLPFQTPMDRERGARHRGHAKAKTAAKAASASKRVRKKVRR